MLAALGLVPWIITGIEKKVLCTLEYSRKKSGDFIGSMVVVVGFIPIRGFFFFFSFFLSYLAIGI